MCGICGVFEFPNDSSLPIELEDTLAAMNGSIVHRGPDDVGTFSEGHCGLGMRRLSIIGVDNGRQPIFNEDRSVVMVMNGEIYNYRELKTDLEAKGHRFSTASDAEIVVHLYEEDSQGFVDRLRGMFAFALWDRPRQRLVLVRDRPGKKPLYWARSDGRLVFASEIKAIHASGLLPKEIDSSALRSYLAFGYVVGERTLFHQVRKLPAGHMLIFKEGSHRLVRYWDLPQPDDSIAFSHDTSKKASRHLRELLEESVHKRLMSEVPLGAFLSGGVDSSAVVAIASQRAREPIHTFSVGVSDAAIDESRQAREVAEHLGTFHHAVKLNTCSLALLRDISYFYDEPVGDPAAVPTYCLSKFARRHITVALTGEGGDEVFAGYRHHAYCRKLAQLDHLAPGFGAMARLTGVFGPLLKGRLAKGFWLAGLSQRERIRGWSSAFTDREMESLVETEMPSQFGLAAVPSQLQEFEDQVAHLDPVARLLYVDATCGLADQLLMKVDKMSMAASLEARCPLLDQEFVEFAASLPSTFKVGPEGGKLIFRLALQEVIPEAILNRPKQGFDVPLDHWFAGDLRDAVASLVLSPASPIDRWVRPGVTHEIWQRHQRDRGGRWALQLWRLLTLAVWLEIHWPSGLLKNLPTQVGSSGPVEAALVPVVR